MSRWTIFPLFLLMLSGPTWPQSAAQCQPPIAPPDPSANMFTPQQERDLGDAVVEQVSRNFRVIEDEDVTTYLQHVGEHIAKHLPPSQIRYDFVLMDIPIANAFSFPGGHIFVSRKLIALMRSEDELAGVLSHELGHQVVHEPAKNLTREFRTILGLTSVGDRKDVFDQYNRLIENFKRTKIVPRKTKEEEGGEYTADAIALYAMASAGYDPNTFATFWDRFSGTKGRTGSWLSDLFGATNPNSMRLRLDLQEIATLPAACREHAAPSNGDEFKTWQSAVVAYSGLGRKESLHGLLAHERLSPPLQSEFTHLRFSPDGNYILAQDDASIYVLSRAPLEPVFRVNAADAFAAEFSPTSQQFVFYTPELRVETWDIPSESQSSVHEMTIHGGCLQSRLSPDAKFLACFNRDQTFNLNLYDVASGDLVFQKKDFLTVVSFADLFRLLLKSLQETEGQSHFIEMQFSPDAHYFMAGVRGDSPVAVDLTTRKAISLPGKIKSLVGQYFIFLGPDRVVGVNAAKPEDSAIVRFPSGEEIMPVAIGNQSMEPSAHGDLFMLRPIKGYAVGVMDPQAKKIIAANSETAFDVYDRTAVTERVTGEVVLVDLDSKAQLADLVLPSGPLGNPRALAVSPDLKWIAVSERTRGAVWNLETKERTFYLHGFRGAYFSNDGLLYADFPEAGNTPRQIGQLDLAQRKVLPGFQPDKDQSIRQAGPVLVRLRRENSQAPSARPSSFEVLDEKSGQVLWSRDLSHGSFRNWISPQNDTMVLDYPLSEAAATDELKSHPEWDTRFAGVKHDPTVHLLEDVDARTGMASGAVLVDTNKRSFTITSALAAGDWLILTDNSNRVLVYSISSGEEKGHIFGHSPVVSLATGMLEVENEPGQLILYDLATMNRRDAYTFSDRVVLSQFSADGKRLFVLTAGQVTYLLDTTQPPPAVSAGEILR